MNHFMAFIAAKLNQSIPTTTEMGAAGLRGLLIDVAIIAMIAVLLGAVAALSGLAILWSILANLVPG